MISRSGNTNNIMLLLNNSYSELGGSLLFTSQSGQQNLDLTGPFNLGDNGVQQSVATTTGQQYTLTFYVGNQDNRQPNYLLGSTVELDINNVFAQVSPRPMPLRIMSAGSSSPIPSPPLARTLPSHF